MHVFTETRLAARNLRARRWRATLTTGLLSVALAATTVVFSAADSLVFRRVTYPNADHVFTFDARNPATGRPASAFATAALLDTWRGQHDLFAAVHGYLPKVIFLTGSDHPELIDAVDVTPGLVEMLGVMPAFGRPLADGDTQRADAQAVLIGERLARARFGDPSAAIGRQIETTAQPVLVVGVMPAWFRFPDGRQQIWRALEPRGPDGANGFSLIAQAAGGITIERAAEMMRARSEGVYRAAGARTALIAAPAPFGGAYVSPDQRRMLLILLGAAVSLLLTACANVASLELAGVRKRGRTSAIHLALGATRASLIRSALIEGACMMTVATTGAAGLAYAGTKALESSLPESLTTSVNQIDIDARSLLMLAGLAALAWLLSSLPAVLFRSGPGLVGLLKTEGRSPTPGRGAIGGRSLSVAQVAVAVMLLMASTLSVRTYLSLIHLDKGFDTSGIVSMTLTIPPQLLETPRMAATAQTVLERVRQRRGVLGAFEGAPPPSNGASMIATGQMELDGGPALESDVGISWVTVDPDYFRVLRIPLLAGRMLEPGDPPANVLITDALAARLWPGSSAVGHRFRENPRFEWNTVVGVVRHVRTSNDDPAGTSRAFQKFSMRQPPKITSITPTGALPASGASYGQLTITARIDSRVRAGDLYQTVRGVDPRNILKVEFADDEYARQFADRLLSARILTAFGGLAFLVAMAGIYGLMAFLVVDREHEIGVRLALGAAPHQIRRMILASSGWLVMVGSIIGIGGALTGSRWAHSMLFGVSATDPFTIGLVTLAVAGTAFLATWHPARQASRVDPSLLLRG